MSVGFREESRSRSRPPLCSHGANTAVLMLTSRVAPIITVEARARSGRARVRSHLSEPQSLHRSLFTTQRTLSSQSSMPHQALISNNNNNNSCPMSSGVRLTRTYRLRDKRQPMGRPSIRATQTVCHQFNILGKRQEPVVTDQAALLTRYVISRRITTRTVPFLEALSSRVVSTDSLEVIK